MRQPQDPDPGPYEEDEDLEDLGTPVCQGTGLSVRALTAEELQRFLHAHPGQPVDPPEHQPGVPRTPPAPTPPAVPAGPPSGTLGSPGRSALAAYRRHRATELAGWTRSLAWRRRWSPAPASPATW